MTTIAIVLLAIVVLSILGLALLSALSRRPDNLGVHNGRLADCPDSPNCVSTFATDDSHHIEPLHFDGPPEAAFAHLQQVVAGMPRARIVTATDRYMHVEFTSTLFRFVDDVEFLLDPDQKLIHFRSASRVGRSDLGVNRKRMEGIRKQLGEPFRGGEK
jgi:uncharacterized protein (DUF1499 family)